MAAQDFGSGLLAGFQGASAMAQQRRDEAARDRQLTQRDAALAQRKTEFEESIRQFDKAYGLDERATNIAEGQESRSATEFDIGLRARENDGLITIAGNSGYFTPGKLNLDTDSLTQGLISGETGAARLALASANRQNKIPGFTFTNVRTLEDGSLVVEGEYEDGRPGVATENGTDDPADPVLTFTPDRLAKLISDDFVVTANESSILGGAKGLTYLAMTGANDADIANINRVRSAQTAVINAVEETGDVGLARQFKGVLAAAESDAEKLSILEEQAAAMGIELPKIQTEGELVEYEPFSTELDSDVLSKPAEDASLKSRNRMLGRLPLLDKKLNEARTKFDAATSEEEKDEIMLNIDDLSRRRQDIIDTQNNVSLEAVSAEIKDLRAKQNKAYLPELKERYQSQLDERTAVKTQLEEALGIRTPIMGSQAYKQLESQVFSRLEAMTPDQVDQAVDNGELTFTPESIQVMRQRLEEANVTSTQDLTKLPTTEQLAYRALLAVIAPDQSARDQFRDEMTNLKETSTLSLSAQEAGEQGINQTNALTNLRNAISRQRELERNLNNDELDRVDDAAKEATKFGEETIDVFFGEESNGLTARSARKYTTTILPRIMTRASSAALPEEQQIYQAAINQGVSLAVAGYAAEEEGGFAETLYSFFRIDAEDVVSSTDFDLSRVGVDMRGGRPATFYYTGPDGRIADERIRATALRNLDDNLYNIVVEAAQKNVEAARFRR